MNDPDSQLMIRFQDGDLSAFEELVSRYRTKLVNFTYRYLGDAQASEDLAQEVFIRIFRAKYKYRPTAKFCTWAFTIAVNLSLNAIRDMKRVKPLSLESQDGKGKKGNEIMDQRVQLPVDSIVAQERAGMVREAVARLSENQRTALLLNRFEGFSYKEVSEVMDLSVQAVKSLLSRAREKVKDFLLPYLEKEGKGPSSYFSQKSREKT